MNTALESTSSSDRHTPDSVLTLAAYLEIALEKGKQVVMMRRDDDCFAVYVGDPSDEDGKLSSHGTISTAVAEELLGLTQVGLNRLTVGDQTYRFFRSFTYISDGGAVVFAPT
jgi:hypothetical protein